MVNIERSLSVQEQTHQQRPPLQRSISVAVNAGNMVKRSNTHLMSSVTTMVTDTVALLKLFCIQYEKVWIVVVPQGFTFTTSGAQSLLPEVARHLNVSVLQVKSLRTISYIISLMKQKLPYTVEQSHIMDHNQPIDLLNRIEKDIIDVTAVITPVKCVVKPEGNSGTYLNADTINFPQEIMAAAITIKEYLEKCIHIS